MPEYFILNTVIQRIVALDEETNGCIYGVRDNGETTVVGFSLDIERNINMSARLTNLYPNGIELCGLVSIGGPYPDKKKYKADELLRARLQNVPAPHIPLLLRKNRTTNDMIELFYLNKTNLIVSSFSVMKYDDFIKKYFYIRIIGVIPVVLPIYSSLESFPDMTDLAKQAATELIFQIEKSDIFLAKNMKLEQLAARIGVLHEMLEKTIITNNLDVLHIHTYYSASESIKGTNMTAPVIVDFSESSNKRILVRNYVKYDRNEMIYYLHADLPLDILCITSREKALDHIYMRVVDAVKSRILLFQILICQNLYEPLQLPKINTYHFFTSLLAHPCTLIFHKDDTEEFLGQLRKVLHKKFHLSEERPCFLKENAIAFQKLHTDPDVLTNVHTGLTDVTGSDCRISLVYGKYNYFHYESQGIDDKGWGGAYRVLQTIYSWFKNQGYTSTRVPSLEEIQEILVSIGDKPYTFKRSREWIGSIEISLFLENKLNIKSRIIHLKSGYEIDSLVEILFEHFDVHGTPIMIGGGCLAHTIIGIQEEVTENNISYLVLDPHYSGSDDLEKMQKEGFIGWKTREFWSASDFYNICLPQRPICF